MGCAAAVPSPHVPGAWGDAKEGDCSCHLSTNPRGGHGLLVCELNLIAGCSCEALGAGKAAEMMAAFIERELPGLGRAQE